MFFKLALMVSLMVTVIVATDYASFTFNGFPTQANLSLNGSALITSNGLLQLTNLTAKPNGHAFYFNPMTFKNSSNGYAFSFSTTFVFAIRPQHPVAGGFGIVFVITPTRGFPLEFPFQYFGVFNKSNDGNFSNHIVGVELDTKRNIDFNDIDDNHVGIDMNGLSSVQAAAARFYDSKTGGFENLSLISGKPMQVWIEYDGAQKRLNVTLGPIHVPKPSKPLLSLPYDLSPIVQKIMYVGFSSTSGSILASHYILGWSFSMNSLQAPPLVLSQLPKLPRLGPNKISKFLSIGVPLISATFIIAAASGIVYYITRKRKFAAVLEDWELDYGPHRFKFKDLYVATKGFGDKEVLGKGGFGRVYRGVLPNSKMEIAVKRVSHESRQGMKAFIAEIVSIGRLGHRNLVQLLGYCRHKGELLLVYEYMPNGSLDKYLYNQRIVILKWRFRFRIIKGVASGLLYLHDNWMQVVIHRDVKASNVLLDNEFNGKLGDFGLARLYDHGSDPLITRVAGTFGYIAPEQIRTGKASTSTDVFAFGVFLLEVACGRKPIEPRMADLNLVDWVFSCWQRGEILRARDPNLGTNYVEEEVELVLKLGLLCSHLEPSVRPCMRQVVQYLEGDSLLPDLLSVNASLNGQISFTGKSLFAHTSSIKESILSQGR